MRALGEQRHQDHEIREREQPLIGLNASAFRGAGDEAEVTALGEVVHMIHADAGEGGDFRVGENFLARLYGNHGLAPRFFPREPRLLPLMLHAG